MLNIDKIAIAAVVAALSSPGVCDDVVFSDVDDLRPIVMRTYGVRHARALDDRTVLVTIGASTTGVRDKADAWRIVSEDDPNYSYEKFVRPSSATATPEKKELEFPGGKLPPKPADIPLTRSEVTLSLPFPLKKGAHYAVIGQGINGADMVTAGACAAKFTLDATPPAIDVSGRVAGLRRVSSVGDGKLLCEFGHGYVPSAGLSLGRWKVTVNGKRFPVKALGRRSRLECYRPVGWPFKTLMQHDVFIDIGKELAAGDAVSVSVDASVCAGAREAGFAFDPAKSLTRSMKANQVGYLPDSLKVAYLGCWMGSMPDPGAKGEDAQSLSGASAVADYYSTNSLPAQAEGGEYGELSANALRFRAPPRFELLTWPQGKAVFSGKAVLVHKGGEPDGRCDHSGENVYTLDFSAFREKGRYVLSVPGVGRSLPFDISPDVYERAFKAQAQGVYCQRCGTALDPKLTGGWKRVACHCDGIAVTTEQRHKNSEWGKFAENCEMVDNPEYKKIAPRIDAIAKTAVWRQEGSYKTGAKDNGFEAQFAVDPKKGATVVFEVMRDDSEAGNKWKGSLVRFGDSRSAVSIDVGWGVLNFGGKGLGRIGDKKWRRAALTVRPADAKGDSEAEFFFDGKKVEPGRRVAKNFAKIPGFVGFGFVSDPGAPGTSYRNAAIYPRALSDEEISLLVSSVPARIPRRIDAAGGHHDAGDYNPRSHIDVAKSLMNAWELKPGNFSDSQLNIPERGNGIPDIIDEAMWAIRLWEGLQDADGGVRNGTESQGDPGFIQTVELDDKGDYAWAKDAQGSFVAAGAFAQASRIMSKVGRKKDAERLLGRARRAYAWGVANPVKDPKDNKQNGEYNIAPRAYAAAELFHTTGEGQFHDDFRKFSPWGANLKSDMVVWGKYDAIMAAYAYSLIPKGKADAKLHDAVVAAIRREADMYISGSDVMAYKFIRNPYSPITWGTGAYENFAVPVAFSWVLTGEGKYRDWLVRSCDNTLGANPLGISWITGLGSRTIRCPLHNSRYRPEGFPVDGIRAEGPNGRGAGYNYTATAYPRHNDGAVPMQEFADVHFAIAMDEPLVNTMANTMMVFGLLSK